MTDEHKQANYQQYCEAEIEMDRVPMDFEQFVESIIADDKE